MQRGQKISNKRHDYGYGSNNTKQRFDKVISHVHCTPISDLKISADLTQPNIKVFRLTLLHASSHTSHNTAMIKCVRVGCGCGCCKELDNTT